MVSTAASSQRQNPDDGHIGYFTNTVFPGEEIDDSNLPTTDETAADAMSEQGTGTGTLQIPDSGSDEAPND